MSAVHRRAAVPIARLLAFAAIAACGDAAAQHTGMHHGPEPAAPPAAAPSPRDSPERDDTLRTPIPALTDADRAAALPPSGGHAAHAMHDDAIHRFVLLDRFEAWNADPGTGVEWEGKAWFGTDRDRLWLRSEGEGRAGHLESADIEALYGRAISPWWDAVVGVRHDFEPGAAQDFAAIGIQGLAPYKFEIAATGYVGASGRTAARVEIEYETLLTNRLILQPLVEANFHERDDARRGTGAGLSTLEAGLRLRYEIDRRFAPYIGIVHERAYGRTATFRRLDGDDVSDTRFVIGARFWF